MGNTFGAIGNQDGTCRIRTKEEIDILIGNADIIRCVLLIRCIKQRVNGLGIT
jgi:hypothetical protein